MMDFFSEHIWLVLFFLWGLPLTFYRSRFRKMVYQTDSWLINIAPRFWLELKALFGFYSVDDPDFVKRRNFYRFYLFIYLLLFTAYLVYG